MDGFDFWNLSTIASGVVAVGIVVLMAALSLWCRGRDN